MTTANLADFGTREILMAAELLQAYATQGAPEDFDTDGVQLMMNQNSGNVFLTNSEYQVAMMNGADLQSFYSSPYEGKEGFYEDLKEEYAEMHPEDKEWFQSIAEMNGDTLEEEETED